MVSADQGCVHLRKVAAHVVQSVWNGAGWVETDMAVSVEIGPLLSFYRPDLKYGRARHNPPRPGHHPV